MTPHEMLQQLCTQVAEISDRTRRTETNMHKMREHMGIAGPASNHVSIIGHNAVRVQGYDVTLSQIRKALLATPGHEPKDKVQIANSDDEVIAVITFFE